MIRAGSHGGRRGAALVVAILLLLALLALAQGALSLARLELTASLADRRILRAGAAARAGVRDAMSGPVPAGAGGVALWGRQPVVSRALDGATFAATLDRLSREVWLLESVGRATEGPAVVRLGRTVWMLDPLGHLANTRAVLQVKEGVALRLDGRVDGAGMTAVTSPLLPGACASWYPALDSVLPSGRLPAVYRFRTDSSRSEPSLGRLGATRLLSLITDRVSGRGTPEPVEGTGGCDVGVAWNWGDPRAPRSPCGGYFVTKATDGDLVVEGGQGQGIVVVQGDLTLTDSTRFYGLLLAGGTLRLENGAEVTGLVRAGGGADLASGTRIEGSACWALLALEGAAGVLDRPVALGGSEWIGPFRPGS